MTEQNVEQYLGDGVYATFDGYHIWLDCRAQPGLTIGPSGMSSIALEPPVLKALFEFARRAKEGSTIQEFTP